MARLEGLNVHFPTSSLNVFAFLAKVNAMNSCVVILPWLRKKRLIPWRLSTPFVPVLWLAGSVVPYRWYKSSFFNLCVPVLGQVF